MAFKEEVAVEELIDIYSKAFNRLTKKVVDAKIRGTPTSDGQLLADINRTINSLIKQNEEWSKQVIPKVYGRTQEEVLNFLEEKGIEVSANPEFRSIHSDAVVELQRSLQEELDTGLIQIGRSSRDNLREITQQATKLNVAGAGEKEAVKEIVNKITKLGMDKIVYSNGARVSIDDYAKMATRTSATASINRATVNQLQSYDRNLVKMSYHSTSCPICAPYQGRVYSMIEGDTEYPYIGEINNGAYISYGVVHQRVAF